MKKIIIIFKTVGRMEDRYDLMDSLEVGSNKTHFWFTIVDGDDVRYSWDTVEKIEVREIL